MPLCPSCIGDHSNYHMELNSKPNYLNIQEVLSETQGLVLAAIANLEKDRSRNVIGFILRISLLKESKGWTT